MQKPDNTIESPLEQIVRLTRENNEENNNESYSNNSDSSTISCDITKRKNMRKKINFERYL